MEDAFEIAKKMTKEFGFKKIDLRMKKATSKYYIPNTEFEIFVELNGKEEQNEQE